jgi:ubiquinone/menaquinone biosynthesis C-methylase UbiE
MKKESKEIPLGAGGSSFELIDAGILFGELKLAKGSTFLDLACGRGMYTLAAREFIGEDGRLYALDLWEEGIESLKQSATSRGITNITARVSDVGKRIPIESGVVDVCLIATVLHDLVEAKADKGAVEEVTRVLKRGGRLAVIEFKKIDGPPGPPLKIRLAPEEVENLIIPFGFTKKKTLDLGPYNYLITFVL